MKKEDKSTVVEKVSALLNEYPHFYIVDIESMNAEKTAKLRRICNKGEIKLLVVKNTLLRRGMSESNTDFSEFYQILKGNTALMFSQNANSPAKVIKEFLKEEKELGKPLLKGAYVQETTYIGSEHLEALTTIKSREELIADVVALLESPIKNVVSSLQSAGQTIHGVLKTLEER